MFKNYKFDPKDPSDKHTFEIHNGKTFIKLTVSENHVFHRFGEFSPTKKFVRHGGKMQKDLDQAKKQAEISAAKAAKAAPAAKK